MKEVEGTTPADVVLPPDCTTVLVQVFVDADGIPMFPTYADGAWELREPAIEAAKEWRVKPVHINGAPIFDFATLPIVFRPR